MSLSNYENTLKSFIHDDDKLVTYKWLSKELDVHINTAKDILKLYWQKYKNQENIIATFLVIGQLKDRSVHVEVVLESNLDSVKNKYLNISSQHLYSLQKFLEDLDLLAYAGEGDVRHSAIKCNEKVINTSDKIENLHFTGCTRETENLINKAEKDVEKQILQQVGTPVNRKQNIQDGRKLNAAEEIKVENKTSIVQKKPSPPSKSNNLTKNADKNGKNPLQSKKTGFNNLFGKVNNKTSTTQLFKADAKEINISNEDVQIVKEKKSEHNACEKENDKDRPKIKDIKRSQSQENYLCSKRKRIINVESSEDEAEKSSNEEQEEEEEEDCMVIEEQSSTTIKRKSPSPPAEKHENGKRMIRKTVDKTYKDEDGYLVTKRVHVYEVAPDDEKIPNINQSSIKQLQPSKTADTKAKKQTTLIKFLKKS